MQSDKGHVFLADQPELYGIPDTQVRDGYAELLSRQNWHWFVTLTFKPDHEGPRGGVHPEKADKAFRVLMSKINRDCFGVRWFKRPDGGLVWARGQEFHKDGRIHFHALVAAPGVDLNTLTRRMWWVDWWWKEFGIARIEVPESQEHVNGYVSKYVTKDGEVDFSPNYGRYVPPALDFGNAVQIEPTKFHRSPAAVAKRTGGHAIEVPETASRCLTLPVRPQLLLLSQQHRQPNIRDLKNEDHDQERTSPDEERHQQAYRERVFDPSAGRPSRNR